MAHTIHTDVLIVGGGAAALRAAIEAHDHGARTTIVLKGRTGKSGATVAPESPAVAWQVADACSTADDSPEVHCQNIVEAGLGMANPRLASLLAHELVDETARLESWGLRFIPDPIRRRQHYCGYSCFANRPRAHGIANSGHGHAGDVVQVLVAQLKRRSVEIHENVFISDLLVDDGTCIGALGLAEDAQVVIYRAGAVVLAAGGARQVFPLEPGRTRIDTTGDSYAMALRAGAELTNMEFTQYMLHPVPPFSVKAPGVFWALAPALKNRFGEDVLSQHLPAGVDAHEAMLKRTLHYPFSTRDESKWIDIAIARELATGGGTQQGALYLDFSTVDLCAFTPSRPQHIPEDFARPVELPEHPVQIRPAAHAVNGGILIDEQAESSLSGLFAVAEAAAGPHGADRLGGGMVSAGQVFGARAGRFAAIRARSHNGKGVPNRSLEQPLRRLAFNRSGGDAPDKLLSCLQAATGKHLVVRRTASGLQSLVAAIQDLVETQLPRLAVLDADDLRRAIEVENALTTATLMAHAAMLRTESRGSHYREDFPDQDDTNWRRNIIFHCNGEASLQYAFRSIEHGNT